MRQQSRPAVAERDAHEARRAAFRQRLIERGHSGSQADEIIRRWEAEAERRQLAQMTSAYWGKAWSWIAAQR